VAATVWSWEFDRNRPAAAAGPEALAQPPIKDEFWQRLLKAVPLQAVGFITAANALASAAADDFLILALGGVFAFGALLALLEMIVLRKAGTLEVAVALGAYLVWVYAQGGVFDALGWYQPIAAGLIALAYAALLPFIPKRSS
jgi:hypothetical protein